MAFELEDLINIQGFSELESQLDKIESQLEQSLLTTNKLIEAEKDKINEIIKSEKIRFTEVKRIENATKTLISEYDKQKKALDEFKDKKEEISKVTKEIQLELGNIIDKSIDFGNSITDSNKQYQSLISTTKTLANKISVLNFNKLKESIKVTKSEFQGFLKDLSVANGLINKLKVTTKFSLDTAKNIGKSIVNTVGGFSKDAVSLLLDYLSQFKEQFSPIVDYFKVLNEKITLFVSELIKFGKSFGRKGFEDWDKKIKIIEERAENSIKLERELNVLTAQTNNQILELQNKINKNNNTISSNFASLNEFNTLTVENYKLQKEILETKLKQLEKEIALEKEKLGIYITQNKTESIKTQKEKVRELELQFEGLKIEIEGINGSLNDFVKTNVLNNYLKKLNSDFAVITRNLQFLNEYLNNNFVSFADKFKAIDLNTKNLTEKFSSNLKKIASLSNVNINLKDVFKRFENENDFRLYLEQLNVEKEIVEALVNEFSKYKDKITELTDIKRNLQQEIADRNTQAQIDIDTLELQNNIEILRNKISELDDYYLISQQSLQEYISELDKYYSGIILNTEKYYDLLLENPNLTELEKEKIKKEKLIEIDKIRYEEQIKANKLLQEQYLKERDLLEEVEKLKLESALNTLEKNDSSLSNNIISNYTKIIKITKERYEIEKKLLELEKEKELRNAKTQTEIDAINEKYEILFSNLDKKYGTEKVTFNDLFDFNVTGEFVEKARAIKNELLNLFSSLFSELENSFNQRFDLINERLERQREFYSEALEFEREKALLGLENNLSTFEQKIVELEAKRRENERKKALAQLVFSFLQAYNNYLKESSPKEALVNATRDVIAIKAFANQLAGVPMFAKGVENFQGKGTETSDSNLVRISKGESVVTAKGTQNYSGLVTAINKDNVQEWIIKNLDRFNKLSLKQDYNPINNGVNISLDVFENIIEEIKNNNIKTIRRLKK